MEEKELKRQEKLELMYIKQRCLELANRQEYEPSKVIQTAKEYFDFITNV